jgi:hypothetical protein
MAARRAVSMTDPPWLRDPDAPRQLRNHFGLSQNDLNQLLPTQRLKGCTIHPKLESPAPAHVESYCEKTKKRKGEHLQYAQQFAQPIDIKRHYFSNPPIASANQAVKGGRKRVPLN